MVKTLKKEQLSFREAQGERKQILSSCKQTKIEKLRRRLFVHVVW